MGNPRVRTVFLLLLFLASRPITTADEQSTSTVALSVETSGDEADQALGSIIFDLVAVELEWAGFSVRSDGGVDHGGHEVSVTYETSENEMRFAFAWTVARSTQATIERTVDVGLGMDFLIANAIRQLVSQAGVRALDATESSGVSESSGESESQEPVSNPETVGRGDGVGGSENADRTTSDTRPEVADRRGGDARTAPETGTGAISEPGRGRLLLDAGGGLFVSVGSAARYFAAALGASVYLGYQIPSGWLGLGVAASGSRFYAEGIALSSVGYLAGVGPGIRLILSSGPFLQFSGGPAILGLDNVRTGFVYGTMPYASAKIGVPAQFSPSVRLLASVEFQAFFLGTIVLMGISPSVELSVRL
jgi:hypothetical protein